MTSDRWGIAGFLAVYFAVKIIDYLLPGGHHFPFADRWAKKDDKDEEKSDDT